MTEGGKLILPIDVVVLVVIVDVDVVGGSETIKQFRMMRICMKFKSRITRGEIWVAKLKAFSLPPFNKS